MPTYDYKCDACGHQFEEMQSFTADLLKTCPKCGKDTLRRLFGTGAAILFKGGGFYETDYRSEGYKSAEKADATASKPAESTPSTSPATTPAASTPAKSDGPAKSS
ncbi:MAG TPA: FmdB family zinc ribbon protein [Gemmataceae bacterium]|jgi:putative FmdB family regulatory protein|nr:FmdB family zinc ribbon protein [Gemmataceae bacterium]